MELREFSAVNQFDTLSFFYAGLRGIPPAENFSVEEALFVASVLSHYAHTSCADTTSMPAPQSLMDVFDNFVLTTSGHADQELMETAGAQSLLMAGFFRDYMRRRHHVRWFDTHGSTFFARASILNGNPRKQKLLSRMSENFRTWAHISRNLNRRLREERLLIKH